MTVTESVAGPPTQIAGYRVEHVLGTGGMATVYLVENPSLQRHEALKVIKAELAADPGARDCFDREAALTASLTHPNIVGVFARGETDDGHRWIAMEYVGNDAETAMRHNNMGPLRAVHIITEVARALDYAHRRGVIHQDIKPSNFLLADRAGEPERVVLSDFGSAAPHRHTAPAGTTRASVVYAAPEVFLGEPADARCDVYALGCSFFRLLTGRYPFFGATPPSTAEAARAHTEQAPPRLSDYVPWATGELDAVLATAMAKDPSDRYPTAGQFAAAAEAALRPRKALLTETPMPALPPPAFPPTAESVLPKRPRRTPRRAAAAGIGLAAIAVLVWLVKPSAPSPGAGRTFSDTATPTETVPSPAAVGRLRELLPRGYPAGACTPQPTSPPGVAAVITCASNDDLAGPTAASYTLFDSGQTLQAAFRTLTASATTVLCPGNIQSPGAWKRRSNPSVPIGTVYCATRGDRQLVAWTDDQAMFLATIEAPPGALTLEQLYGWWGSHS